MIVRLAIWSIVRVVSFDMVDVLDIVDCAIPPLSAWSMVTMNKNLIWSYESVNTAIAKVVVEGEGQIRSKKDVVNHVGNSYVLHRVLFPVHWITSVILRTVVVEFFGISW